MDDPFDACWHRIERAATHRKSAGEIWNGFIKDHPYDFALDHQGDGVFILRVWQESPTPPELAVVIGEWFYNVRCTLDYIVWATAVCDSGKQPPPQEGQLQYPIYDEPSGWTGNLYRLKPLAQHHRDMLEHMQPYKGEDEETRDANYLGWVNRIARIDRHRRLSIVTAYMAEVNPVIQLPSGCTAAMQFGNRVLVDGYADIARITVTPWEEGWNIQANPRVGIDPEIEEWSKSPFWQKIPFNERFPFIEAFVMGEIASYEFDCTGATRKPDLVTDSFRAEADARRTRRKIERHRDEPSEWGPAMPGEPSTQERFEGRDFPADGPGKPPRRWEL